MSKQRDKRKRRQAKARKKYGNSRGVAAVDPLDLSFPLRRARPRLQGRGGKPTTSFESELRLALLLILISGAIGLVVGMSPIFLILILTILGLWLCFRLLRM